MNNSYLIQKNINEEIIDIQFHLKTLNIVQMLIVLTAFLFFAGQS